MPCTPVAIGETVAIVCTPTYSRREIRRARCFTEGKRREHLMEFAEWHGWKRSCFGCGDIWSDETEDGSWERLERPFRRNWRSERIKSIKERAQEVRHAR